MIGLEDLSKEQLEDSILQKLERLCKSVLDKNIKDVSDRELMDMLSIEMNTCVDSINVYCQSTRQIEQYQPNGYSASETISLKASYEYMISEVAKAPTASEKLVRYIELKAIFYKVAAHLYHKTEGFLRDLLREAEVKDGAPGLGRHKD